MYDAKNGVATVTLNRPDKLNALLEEMWKEMLGAIDEADKDESVRVLVLTGAGRAFCAGADVARLVRQAEGTGLVHEHKKATAPVGEWAQRIYEFPKPTIAAVNGIAAGAGFPLALACDIRIASEAAKFSAAWLSRGLPPDGGTTYLLPRIVGVSKSCELLYTGATITAKEAQQLGMVSSVVPADKLMETVSALAAKIASGPPIAMEFTKKAIYRNLTEDIESSLHYETHMQLVCFGTEDFKEGVKSFQEKRSPSFKGK